MFFGLIGDEVKKIYEKYYTEGVENVAWVEGISSGTGSIVENADHIYVECTYPVDGSGAYRTIVTDNMVDLTNIKKLYVDCENFGSVSSGNYFYFIVSTEKNQTGLAYTARVQILKSFSRDVVELDVSTLTGNYYIRCNCYAWSYAGAEFKAKFYRIWGEG